MSVCWGVSLLGCQSVGVSVVQCSRLVSRGKSKSTWCLTSTETIRLIRAWEKVGRGEGGLEGGGGEREIIFLSLHCHHQNDFCIKMGSDESRFNVSVGSDGRQSHRTVSTNHNLF